MSSAVNAPITDAKATATIVDDEGPITVSVADASVNEGNSGTRAMVFTISLSASPATGQTVKVTVATANGTATAGTTGDYNALAATVLTFTAGQTTRTLNVIVRGDLVNEPNETLRLNLTAPVAAVIADSQGTGTITNDD